MQRKLTITIDEAVYEGLYRKVGPRKIARFIEEIVRPHVLDADLDAEYEEMAHDEMRERDAEEWSEAIAGRGERPTKNEPEMNRGEVWWVSPKQRPAVIVSNNAANRHLNRVQLVPLATATGRVYPSEAMVRIGAGGTRRWRIRSRPPPSTA